MESIYYYKMIKLYHTLIGTLTFIHLIHHFIQFIFNLRMKNIKLLELMINKKSRPELNTIRVKDLIRFESLDSSLFTRFVILLTLFLS